MSQVPTPYTPSFNFFDWASQNPNIPAPGQKFDIEFQNLKTLLDAMLARAAEIQRDDGKLRNGSVGRDQLSVEFASGVDAPTIWAQDTDYAITSSVQYQGSWYWALVAHNSGNSFDASKWQYIGTFFSDDPLLLALDKTSLIDGILSADAAGRAKMADGYVTLAKLAAEVKGGFPKAWANFYPNHYGVNWSFTFVGNTITATSLSGDLSVGAPGFGVGSTITFSGQAGNNTVLNGSWKVLTFNGTTQITFQVGSTPAGALSSTTGNILVIYSSFNIKTITRVSDGTHAVAFTNSLTDANYVISGTTSTYATQPIPRSVVGIDYSSLPQTTGFTLLTASWQTNVGDFFKNNPDRVMFLIFGN